jgi:predicted nuclease of predicted toxin-antitoxin system
MALRFLADHCVSNSTVQTLREANHEVLRLKDVLPAESSHTIVITKAQELDAILLSLNGDFSHIVNWPSSQQAQLPPLLDPVGRT